MMHARGDENRASFHARKRVQTSALSGRVVIPSGEDDAWLFDLDGEVTDTASVHAAVSGVRAEWSGGFGLVVGELAELELW